MQSLFIKSHSKINFNYLVNFLVYINYKKAFKLSLSSFSYIFLMKFYFQLNINLNLLTLNHKRLYFYIFY